MKLKIRLIVATFVLMPNLILAQTQPGLAAINNGGASGFGSIRGLIKPEKKAILSSEISARIIKLPYKTGASFKKGNVLISFDCSLYSAELAAAKAEHLARSKRLENNRQLLGLNAISNIEVDISEAEVQRARADQEIAQVKVNQCSIQAPYDGRVVESLVNEYESVAKDQQLLSILNSEDLEIELIVPSMWLSWLRSGAKFRITIDEMGKTYNASVLEIGAAVDPVSQTVRIIGQFEADTDSVLPGMSGEVVFENAESPDGTD